MLGRITSWLGLPLLIVAGCLYADIDEVEANTPIATIRAGSYPLSTGFGSVMATYVGVDAAGAPIARVAGTAGPGSPQLIFDLWSGPNQGSRGLVFDGCEDEGDCERGSGADVIGLPAWSEGRRDCVLSSSVSAAGEAVEGLLRVQCEGGTTPILRLPPVMGIDFGRSLAPLFLDHPLGVALVGAPEDGAGGIYRLEADNASPIVVPLPDDLTLAAGARLGQRLATFDLGRRAFELDNAVVVLASASGERRVIALAIGNGPDGVASRTIACIEDAPVRAPSENVDAGGSFTLADIDGDEIPEALIGDPAGNRIRRVSLTGAMGAGCESAAPVQTVIACGELAQGDVSACNGFGASIAAGDYDDDGDTDIAVGAPRSDVRGINRAGAVFVIPGDRSTLSVAGSEALTLANSVADTELGTALGTAPSQLTGNARDEPVASAPGRNRLYVFYCTGLSGDTNDANNRCLPEGG